MEHFKKLENMYVAAPINELYKPLIQIANSEARIEIIVNTQFFHAANALHGSVYFKMLDDAAFFAANSIINDVFVLTGSFEIKLLRPVYEGALVAEGKIEKIEGDKIYAKATLFNNDKLVAKGKGIFFKSDKKLEGISSYKIV